MRRLCVTAALAVILIIASVPFCRADVTVGATIGDDGLKEFHLAIGKQYNYPEKQVVVIREKNIPEDELPVVFFIARRAQVTPMTIVKLRQAGQTWWEISLHYGLSPDIFFIPVHTDPGPPYGRAYGYYKDRDKHHWKNVRLEDADIINLVNLRFICERYQWPPDEVIKLRAKGDDFVRIHTDVKRGRDHKANSSPASKTVVVVKEKDKPKDRGQGKNHKK
jgi:hypothetical protein